MHQLAFPSSVSNEFGLDLFQWLRELRLQKIVANSANGFLSPPAIEFLGAMVPKVNSTRHATSHDAVIDQLKNILRLLIRRHCLFHWRSGLRYLVSNDRAKEKAESSNILFPNCRNYKNTMSPFSHRPTQINCERTPGKVNRQQRNKRAGLELFD